MLNQDMGIGNQTELTMATTAELKSVLREALENRGVLGQLRARIRAEVFNALDDQSESRPSLSHENLLINELIRDYLEFNNYKYTRSVLLEESGQPKEPLDREFLAQELNISQDQASSTVPLLYGMLSYFLQRASDSSKARDTTTPPHTQTSQRRPAASVIHRSELTVHSEDPDSEQENLPSSPKPLVVQGGK